MPLIYLVAAAVAALPRPLTQSEQRSIAEAVQAQLRDPQSAQFDWLPLESPALYCGVVNSKNGYGGYVGKTNYMIRLVQSGGTVQAFGSPTFEDRSPEGRTVYLKCQEAKDRAVLAPDLPSLSSPAATPPKRRSPVRR